LSLLGLVRHMAKVERIWFRAVMAGLDDPRLFADRVDADFDDAADDPAQVDEAFALWQQEIAFADRFVTQAPDLDLESAVAHRSQGVVSLRWVLVHMIEEYARHNGHADLLRERIDGVVGE
jgi:uncharacterized damage-inducible protein DinB